MSKLRKIVLSMLVDNTAGVLTRISGLFARRGYNIDSLTVSETENSAYSRATVVASGDDRILDQIRKQLSKLEDVIEIIELSADNAVTRELALVKVAVQGSDRQEVIAVADIFRAKIVDVATDSLMVELTGNQAKIDAFIRLLSGFNILEMVRTGLTGLTRGASK